MSDEQIPQRKRKHNRTGAQAIAALKRAEGARPGAKQGYDFLLSMPPLGDPGKPVTEAEGRVVDDILASPMSDMGNILRKHGVEMTAVEFGSQAHVQMYTRLRIAQWEAQTNMLVTSTIKEITAMAFADAAVYLEKPMEEWTEKERRAITKLKITEKPDGSKVTEVSLAKIDALREFIKMFGLGPTHPQIKSLLKVGAPPEEKAARQAIMVGGVMVEF